MELQLQDLLNTIKKDGVETAQKEADAIIADAKAKSEKIISDAKKEADGFRQKAEQDAAQFESSAKAAISQAGRDILISVRQALQKSFDRIVEDSIKENFSGEKLAEGILAVVKNFKISGALELSEKDLKAIESNLKGKLGAELKAGLNLNVSRNLNGGFMLKEKDGKAYYDFSDKSIAEVIKTHLSSHIAELIEISQ